MKQQSTPYEVLGYEGSLHINRSKIMYASFISGLTGIGMLIGGCFLDGMAKEALLITGALFTVLGLSIQAERISLCFTLKNSYRDLFVRHHPAAIVFENLAYFFCSYSIPALCLGYGAVHIGITPLLEEVGLDFAATIGLKCLIAGGLAFFSALFFCHTLLNSLCKPDSAKCCKAIFVGSSVLGAMAATVLPEIIANAVGMQGEAAVAFEVLTSAGLMFAVATCCWLTAVAARSAVQAYQTKNTELA